MSLTDYVNEKKIIKVLIKLRAKLAFSRHKDHLISEITSNTDFLDSLHFRNCTTTSEFDFLTSILPPRRKWVTLNEKERVLYQDSFLRNIRSLEITISKEEKSSKKSKWFLNLKEFIAQLISKFYSHEYKISNPQLLALIKENKKNGIVYRPISKYQIEDRIILSLVTKYLTDSFDFIFKEFNCAYAFRSTCDKQKISHHDCVAKVVEYLYNKKDEDIFVVECDIKKFFDCINHEKLKDQFNKFVQLTKENGCEIDIIAQNIFLAYLNSYSFKLDVYSKNSNRQWFRSNNLKPGKFKWEEEDLLAKYYKEGVPDTIGVAQGGALSCLISNIYLHYVDEKILSNKIFKNDLNLLYVRFCDDMILLHSDIEKCKEALQLYVAGIEELKLLHHATTFPEIDFYNKKFWSEKAKPIYKWASNSNTKCIPWLAFVGYQIRRDGLVRVRRSSILKEKTKMINERMRVMKALGFCKKGGKYQDAAKNIRLPRKNIVYRLENRYISMSVGKIDLRGTRILKNGKIEKINMILPQGLCWTNGFKLIKRNHIVAKQLKELDRFRYWNIKHLDAYLKHIEISTNSKIGIQNKKVEKEIKIKYFGHPFSYHYFLKSKENETES